MIIIGRVLVRMHIKMGIRIHLSRFLYLTTEITGIGVRGENGLRNESERTEDIKKETHFQGSNRR
jgi:hypothetical protein